MVSNAGGVNPLACAAAVQEVVHKAGLSLKVAVVTGDDLMPQVRSSTCSAMEKMSFVIQEAVFCFRSTVYVSLSCM